MSTTGWDFSPRTPTRAEKIAFAVLVALYAALLLGTAPWAATPGLADPRLAAVAATAIFVADVCTALLLAAWYLSSGRPALLVLTATYGYGALMAVLHLGTFPGALFPATRFGTEQTVAWLYLAWRSGMSVAYLVAVLVEAARPAPTPASARWRRLTLALTATVAATGALAYYAADPGVAAIDDTGWTNVNDVIAWGCVALAASAVAVILANRAFDHALYLWLAAVIVAGAADLALATLGGERYTLGWHLARTSFVVSSYLLLAFAIGALSPQGQQRLLATIAAYGGALAAVLTALLLRWLLTPWLDVELVPYITLFGAIAVAVGIAGWRPAVFATAVGYVLIDSIYLQSPTSLIPTRTAEVMQLVLFTISSGLIIGLGEGMRRARDLYRTSEMELRQRAAQLQRADAHKSQFLAVLSHELRNPLAPLRSGLAILKHKPAEPAADRTIAMMERQVTHLTRLIDDLLDVSRIDRGKLDLRKERVALDAVFRSAIETAMPSIEAKQHELVVRYAGQPLFVDGDSVRLAQVIANLLHNAAKFTPAGGRIELALRAEGDTAVITVKDSGIGIEPEHLEDVFGMFVQLDATRDAKSGGLGLGLTLVRSLVAQHGGRITAHSAGKGQGAEFIVTLPLAPAPAAPAAVPIPPRDDARRRILVVDDNVDAAEVLAELLRLHGHAVETAHDGHAALRVADAFDPDVAFIDLNMPGLDGVEVARRLRARPGGRALKLIALTGMGQKSDVKASLAAGFDEHLTKPADPKRIAALAAGTSNVLPLVSEDGAAGRATP